MTTVTGSAWQAISGPGRGAKKAMTQVGVREVCSGDGWEVREATTGQVITVLPQVWAVGAAAPSSAGAEGEAKICGFAKAAVPEPGEEVAFYRKYTEALLRRYQRLSLQAGRVPSPMDREMFRGRMSHYKVQGFDDAVIFCTDVERCLLRLNGEDQRLVRRIAVQEYTMGEAAGLLGVSLRSCIVRYRRALDRTTRLFLEARLLEPERSVSRGAAGPS